jgi:tRNA 2-selenouridine synthase
LNQRGEPIIDLEKIAGHKGSAFGNIGLPAQPSQEQFENLLGMALLSLGIDGKRSYNGTPIWIEDESQRIGTVNIPQPFWLQMRSSPVYFLDIPFPQRLIHIVKEYGVLDKQSLKDAATRISKRLGGMETKITLEKLEEGDIAAAFSILLHYYDKWYLKGLYNRNELTKLLVTIKCEGVDAVKNATLLSSHIK